MRDCAIMASRNEEIEEGRKGGSKGARDGKLDGLTDGWKERVSEQIKKGGVEELRVSAIIGSRNEEIEGGGRNCGSKGAKEKEVRDGKSE